MNRQQLIKEIENNYQVSNQWNDKEKALQLAIVNNPVTTIDINKVLEILKLEQTEANYSKLENVLNNNINLFWDFINKFAVSGVHGFLYEYMKYYYFIQKSEGTLKEVNKELYNVIKNVSNATNLDYDFIVNIVLVSGINSTLNNNIYYQNNIDDNILIEQLEKLKNEIKKKN